jgi:hypothetical protein
VFVGLFGFLLALGLVAAFPKTRKALGTHRRAVITLSLVYLALLFAHPYILGLPGRIAEARFQKAIRPGMTRSELQRLADEYGGRGLLGGPLHAERSSGLLIVSFTDSVTFCIVGGKEYDFYFRPDSTLTEWKTRAWANAC